MKVSETRNMNINIATYIYATNSAYTGKQSHKYAYTHIHLRNNSTYTHTLHARYMKTSNTFTCKKLKTHMYVSTP